MVLSDQGYLFSQPDSTLRTHRDDAFHPYFYAEDQVDLELPPGNYTLRVAGGPTIIPGEYPVSVSDAGDETTVYVERWIVPRDWGWIGADPHVHLTHQGERGLPDRYPLLTSVAARAGRAEDLDLVYLLENRADTPSGVVDMPQKDVLVVWGEEFRSGWWGHLVILGAKTLVTVDGNPWANGLGFPAWPMLQKILQDARPPLVYQAHPDPGGVIAAARSWPETGIARELPSLARSGTLHAVATGSGSNRWDRRWNPQPLLDGLAIGARWASVGETDGVMNRHDLRPLGSLRTYAWIERPAAPTRPKLDVQWRDAVRAKHCYATSGPLLLDCRLDGARLGETLQPTGGSARLQLHLVSWTPLTRVTLLGSGGRREDLPVPAGQQHEFFYDGPIDLPRTEALLVEAVAVGGTWFAPSDSLYLISSPIWVDTATPAVVPLDRARVHADGLREVWRNSLRYRFYSSAADSLAARKILLGNARAWENAVDDPPTPPIPLYPEQGRLIGSSGLRFLWQGAFDPDQEQISYTVELSADAQFTSPASFATGADTFLVVDDLTPGQRYWWKVGAQEADGDSSWSQETNRWFEITSIAVDAPAPGASTFHLRPARSAPGEVRMILDLSHEMTVRLRWFDARGRVVRSDPPALYPAGSHFLHWDGRDDRGQRVASGVYWLVADAEGVRRTRSTILIAP